jgi:hypothetical protein
MGRALMLVLLVVVTGVPGLPQDVGRRPWLPKADGSALSATVSTILRIFISTETFSEKLLSYLDYRGKMSSKINIHIFI